MADKFSSFADDPNGSSRHPFAITPDDTNPLPQVPKRIYVGFGGDICLRGVGSDEDVTYTFVPNGVYISVRPEFIRATGTTAANLIGEA